MREKNNLTYYKFGDGDYYFLRKEPRGSAKPGRRALKRPYFLINHKIALNSLMTLKSHHIHKLMRELSVSRKPSTVNKYVQLICHAWRVAKREWGINLPLENPGDMVTLPKVKDARDRVPSKSESKLSKSISV